MVYEEIKRPETQPKKSKERGWYRVEGIIGHRVTKIKNKDQIELKVKWEDYSEPTWEAFTGFVKDTAPMVERYLIKKSLMKPLQAYYELKRLKSLELDASDPSTAAAVKELKNSFVGFEQFFQQKSEKTASTKVISAGP